MTDFFSIVDATVTGTLSTGGTVTFKNDGSNPDDAAGDPVYSANVPMPATPTNLVITVVANAPGKLGTTNHVLYQVVAPPLNDNFSNAVKIAASGGLVLGNNEFATTEPAEPDHAGALSSSASLWWTFAPAVSGTYFVDSTGSTFDTLLAVYTGTNVGALTKVAAVDDVGSQLQGYLSFSATAGTTYRVAVAGYDSSETGGIRLRVERNGGPDTNGPTVTVGFPTNAMTLVSNKVALTGIAADPAPNASGVSEVFILLNDEPVARVATGTTNWYAPLFMNTGANQIRVWAGDHAGNMGTQTVVTVVVLPPPVPNDYFVQAIPLEGTNGTTSQDTAGATRQVDEPMHAGNEGGHSVWWSFTPQTDGVLSLITAGSSFDTLLGLYTGPTIKTLSVVASNDDESGGGAYSQIIAAVRSNTTYYVALDGYGGAAGLAQLTYSLAPGPVVKLTVIPGAGGNATPPTGDFASGISLVLTAMPNDGYEFDHWEFDGTISSANPLNLVLTSDLTNYATFRRIPYTDDFERYANGIGLTNQEAAPGFMWTSSDNKSWTIQSNNVAAGTFAARSGAITNSEVSTLLLSGSFSAGNVSFASKVSSEPLWDRLIFLVDGIARQEWSGESDWSSHSFPLTEGAHVIEWRYIKDANGWAGLDAAFLDNVAVPTVTTPAQMSIGLAPGGGFVIEIRGQASRQYVLEASSNLVDWVGISTNIAAGGVIQLSDPAAPMHAARFYRAVAP
ncbi:MAG: hypothetical protein HY975_01955 [Candidatus Kerfeldbacteria bacterium]|nr:hypothetical protein [Candidatus Kerfeldbacteria bacterium]